jgi:TrmH family RNA methyltransferase
MKNMALKNLILVSSTDAGPETEALPMSSGAYDIIERARRTDSLPDALGDCIMAVGTSARIGRKRSNAGVPEEIVPELMESALSGPAAVVFGRESKGLTNDELALCTHHMIVPTDAEHASMNLAQACAVTAYEIFKIAGKPRGFQVKRFRPASVVAREQMFDQLEKVLVRAGFLDASNPLRMMREVRRILNSAEMDERDVTIVRGMCRKVYNMIRIADEKLSRLEATAGGAYTNGPVRDEGE